MGVFVANNRFGHIFTFTSWGESHGPAIGVVIDGCPAGLVLSESMIDVALSKRRPGRSEFVSPRDEKDQAKILSGVFEGQTTGAPISIMIENQDADTSQYETVKNLLRPGHANYTYIEKYGVFDYRGGGRASARETACRVAAGAVAEQLLLQSDITVVAHLKQVSTAIASPDPETLSEAVIDKSPIFCADAESEAKITSLLLAAKNEGDSLGGIVEFVATGVPAGLGDPVYEKLEANLAKAMMSLPASKGFEIGEGFAAALMQGSTHNDAFSTGDTLLKTNHAGGTLGGISTGQPLVGRVAFKPTSSIRQSQETVDLKGHAKTFEMPKTARHDPCVAIRAVPVVKAMCQLVLADALLMSRLSRA